MYNTAIMVFVGLTIGNFIVQACTKRDWSRATERSFFEALALGAFLIATEIH